MKIILTIIVCALPFLTMSCMGVGLLAEVEEDTRIAGEIEEVIDNATHIPNKK